MSWILWEVLRSFWDGTGVCQLQTMSDEVEDQTLTGLQVKRAKK